MEWGEQLCRQRLDRCITQTAAEDRPAAKTTHFYELERVPLSSTLDVYSVKLTDEICRALQDAENMGQPVTVDVDEQGNGTWIVQSSIFKFQKHLLEDPLDAYEYSALDETFKSCGSVHSKLQIQATDKSFTATRDKTAVKLAEVKSNHTILVNKKVSSSVRVISRTKRKTISPLTPPETVVSSANAKSAKLPRFSAADSFSTSIDNGNKMAHSVPSTMAHSLVSSTASPVVPLYDFFPKRPKPSCDWEKCFTEAETYKDVKKLYKRFCADYPTYRETYEKMRQVTEELRQFENSYKQRMQSDAQAKQLNVIKDQILKRFKQLNEDKDFLEARRRHSDLRAKLTVLKTRVKTWDINNHHSIDNSV